jgi:hypothetical protein
MEAATYTLRESNPRQLHAAKDPEAIKDCIRRNEHVAITLYRDFPASQPSALNSQLSPFNHLIQDRLPLHAINS